MILHAISCDSFKYSLNPSQSGLRRYHITPVKLVPSVGKELK